METTTDILNELESLSPLIAGMNRINVFTVPEGYFDSISATVLACLPEVQIIFNLSQDKESANIPEGYFDQLANSILDKIKAREITASDEIMSLSPLLFDILHKNVFEVPDGYFESLDGVVTHKVKTAGAKEELKALSPLLYSIQSKPVFEVPDEYFDGFPNNILKKVKPVAKVVSMRRRSLFVKYAVAAMLTGVTALGLYKLIDQPHPGVITDSAVATLDASIEKGKNMNDVQFNEALQNLNDNDIAKYLENNGDITDVAAIGNNLEDVNLPSQDDYLLDETTLENYLKEIEKTTLNN